MAFILTQAGSSLQILNTNGQITTLNVPADVTIDDTIPPRFEILNRRIIMVNSPSMPLIIDGNGVVQSMGSAGPTTAPTLLGVPGGALSGVYDGIRYTFITKNAAGDLIGESQMSPAATSITLAGQAIQVSDLEVSSAGHTGRRLYRPTAGGATLFRWLDIDNNVTTTIVDATADAALSTISAPNLGGTPRLYLAKQWKGRLWGVAKEEVDSLRFSEADAYWSWPALSQINIPVVGANATGITALMARKEFLGVGKSDMIWYVAGQTPTDFRLVKLTNTVGVESQESVAEFQDTIWWLWKDGVYQWDAEGVRNVTEGKVKSWFATDDYFNRALFHKAFAIVDTPKMKYRLFLASAGSTEIDRWVEYDIVDKTWWGPHKTDAFSPTCALTIFDDDGLVYPTIGSEEAYLWKEQAAATDHLATGIAMDVLSKWHEAGEPDLEKHWGRPTIMGKAQEAGVVTFTPYVGYTDAEAQAPMYWEMVEGRQSLDRLGHGVLMRFRLTHDTYNEPVQIHGIEFPFNIFGSR